ncbi:alpha/beta fold hydrolase [Coralloluteibacterium stylophorae]|uniref:Alpha/beta hydrolase n=1 Tax=Coralloluteibacterium stylophorae TaxID=1776034 RepID=A0A8J7VTK1_9GAMM|nr:alpha/beta hydrolase [Coralloluteibacterium stylophorae]MBS7457114.1 alpha/beta hydrolase [Coralloluteibacterium stylophorae]
MRDAALDTPRGRFAALRGGRVGAPRVLALHGWLDNAASFLPLAPHLGDIELVALDLAGHGRSFHRSAEAEYGFLDYLLDVAAALDALAWRDAGLLGHSLGGAVAVLFAAVAPARVRRLALVESAGPLSGDPAQAPERMREAFERRVRPSRGPRVFADLDVAVRARMQANGLSEPAARLLVERGTRAVDGGFVWSSDPRLTWPSPLRMDEASVQAVLRAITVPVRVVMGSEHHPSLAPALREARLACLREVRVEVVPGHHHLHMETPEPVARCLADVFAEAPDD